jgi:hypothetical protein
MRSCRHWLRLAWDLSDLKRLSAVLYHRHLHRRVLCLLHDLWGLVYIILKCLCSIFIAAFFLLDNRNGLVHFRNCWHSWRMYRRGGFLVIETLFGRRLERQAFHNTFLFLCWHLMHRVKAFFILLIRTLNLFLFLSELLVNVLDINFPSA